ncbi:integrase [Bacillus thuringiensis]|uniref:tyrosine-type recombinase/integrase n=1 Tax=Bacillus cereus group TaxID=86661 RepID=UPI000BFCFA60|nr:MULTISPECIES: tyrosine-type recombinase/integrase [Bacillus cereus group]KAA6455961.1 integrase [Bacillus cereus]KAB2436787.1 tyrosine-type recombinase/integrase [Bacillus cereus]KAB2468157.1 tyrosine-type recombinase/integrase [Bacillus cereus]MBJ7939516.1 tyrosine-type recombinase/integrase [Bacillus cereus]PGQ38652.1 integrase [Bacillus thuringiensis]
MTKKEHLIDVQPIRDKEQIEKMKWALGRHCSERDYILFLIGINTGLRVSDLLQLKTEQIIKLKRRKRKEFMVREGKTKKERMVNITSIFNKVHSYAEKLESEWLFPSRKGDKPISKIQAYRQLQKAGEWAEIESIGTHTMRKTFGYWFYKQTKDIAMLQDILNHSTPQITLKYICINKEEKDNVLDKFEL